MRDSIAGGAGPIHGGTGFVNMARVSVSMRLLSYLVKDHVD